MTTRHKIIYRPATVDAAEKALDEFSAKWDSKFPMVSGSWYNKWDNIIPFFDYPEEIRKVVYTTNAIELLNSVIRKAIKNRKIFPNDTSVFKMIYLAIQSASTKWTMPIHNWRAVLNRFALEFEGGFSLR